MRVLDLGSGQGAMALMIAAMADVHVVGLERNARALATAQENQLLNADGLQGKVAWIRADLRALPWVSGQFDMVVMNPPYYRVGEGRLSPDAERAEARHEVHGTLRDWILAARSSLRRGGVCWCLQTRERAGETIRELETHGFIQAKENDDKPAAPFAIIHGRLAD